VPQRFHRFDGGRPPRRHECGNHSNYKEDRDRQYERQRIARMDAV
jgi:hypothetical protein